MRLADSPVLEQFAWSRVLIVDDDQASALLALKLLLRAGLRSVETMSDASRHIGAIGDTPTESVAVAVAPAESRRLHTFRMSGASMLVGDQPCASSCLP